MSLTTGTRLGPYEIVTRIGAGGMGEVFKACDTRLDRIVAVKMLSRELAGSADFRERFQREAKAISQLNHPHICTLFDIGDHEGAMYLVMEFIEGETLADRLARGALPISDVLRFGAQIADALRRAHDAGTVHRDLKPGNIMLTKSGAKLLDFGLAKTRVDVLRHDTTQLVTELKPLTGEGTIAGTLQYMAPEQLEAQEADPRTDIFALGAVLYEMTTGKRAFEGKTNASIIAAIMEAEPLPVAQLQPLTPPLFEHVVSRCLAKDRNERWQTAKDLAEELKWISSSGMRAAAPAATSATPRREKLAWFTAAVALLAAAGLAIALTRRPAAEKLVASVNAPGGAEFAFTSAPAVLSLDGEKIAFVARDSSGDEFLWVRPLARSSAQRLARTEGAQFPFWSPDARHLGFFAGGKLMKIDAGGGEPQVLADAPAGRGGAWNQNGDIVFAATAGGGLSRVSDAGGEITNVTALASDELSHRFPFFLPDGQHFIYYSQGPRTAFVRSLRDASPKPLVVSDTNAIYSAGYLLYTRDATLRAQRFDPESHTVSPEVVTLAQNVQASSSLGFANVSAAAKPLLTYVTGGSATSRIVWLDRSGAEVSATAPADYLDPRISPDGKKVALAVATAGYVRNLFVHDSERQVQARFTLRNASEWGPVWSHDGQWIAYTSLEGTHTRVNVRRASGTEPARAIVTDRRYLTATEWSRDGRFIVYQARSPATNYDIEIYSTAEGSTRLFLQSPFSESQARLSPDNRWVAYVSDESGADEVYVRPFEPRGPEKWQISTAGGSMPVWSHDGSELFYVTPDRLLMHASVRNAPGFRADLPKALFPIPLRRDISVKTNQYDVSPDGKTFVVNAATPQEGNFAITIVQNWTE